MPQPTLQSERRCENPACGCVLVRKQRESEFHWERRRACSRPCAGVLGGLTNKVRNNARRSVEIAPDRFCALGSCGAKLVRRSNESMSDFRGRSTCSRACAAEYMRDRGGPAFVQRQKSSKAPCSECYGLAHRRPVTGCPKCGGQFRRETAA